MKRMKIMNIKEIITDKIDNCVDDFLYDDRKDDESLLVGDIEDAIVAGKITKQEVIDTFVKDLNRYLDAELRRRNEK